MPEAQWPKNLPKKAAFMFVKACLEGELHIDAGECFALSDLFGDDTTGFVKVRTSPFTLLALLPSRFMW